MESLGLVVVFAVLAAAGGLALLMVRRDRKLSAARAELAALRGWRYAAGGGGRTVYSVEGEEGGAAWRVECKRGRKNSPGRTFFTCPGAAVGGGVVYVGAPGAAAVLKSSMGRTVAEWAMRLGGALGAETGPLQRLMEQGVEVEVGGPDFAKRFTVLATDEALARRTMTTESCGALQRYAPDTTGGRYTARALSATWSEEGLKLTLDRELAAPEAMASFSELGIALAKESRGTGW